MYSESKYKPVIAAISTCAGLSGFISSNLYQFGARNKC